MSKKRIKIKDLLGEIKISTSHYDAIPKIDQKNVLLVSVSGGILSRELKKTYGEDRGDEYFYAIDVQLGNELAPSWKIFSTYKKSLKSDTEKELEYYESYIEEILSKVNLEDVLFDILTFAKKSGKNEIVFLCYEKPTEFCHRFILSAVITKTFKIKIKESFMEKRQRIIPEYKPGRLILG